MPLEPLPTTLEEAVEIAKNSEFVKSTLSEEIRANVFEKLDLQIEQYRKSDDKDKFEEKYYFKTI